MPSDGNLLPRGPLVALTFYAPPDKCWEVGGDGRVPCAPENPEHPGEALGPWSNPDLLWWPLGGMRAGTRRAGEWEACGRRPGTGGTRLQRGKGAAPAETGDHEPEEEEEEHKERREARAALVREHRDVGVGEGRRRLQKRREARGGDHLGG